MAEVDPWPANLSASSHEHGSRRRRGGASCRVGLATSWHSERVNYYANTGCTGIDAEAVTVTVEGPDGHRDTSACQDKTQFLFACAFKELEGSFPCGDRCGETVLAITHRVELPPDTQFSNLEQTSCTLESAVVTCSYRVRMNTVTVRNVWSFEGEEYVCIPRAIGEQRIPLDAIGDLAASTALLETVGGAPVTEATAEAVREAAVTAGNLREVAEDDDLGQCDDDAPGSE